MADEPMPQVSCKICNNEPKYKCPRCHRHTCSLPCYKRHQKLYDCSGKRDPAAKLSRAQLTASSAVEHDYQFLSGVERAFENADRDVSLQGFSPPFSSSLRRSGKVAALEAALERGHVSILRAPPGMSRQKSNNTRWNPKRKNVVWTVEWLLPDGTSSLNECSEKTSLRDAYHDAFVRPLSAPSPKKRKTSGNSPDRALRTSSVVDDPMTGGLPGLHFYLVKPFTKGGEKVVVPLNEHDTLATSLQKHEVFEFPTLQVLKQGQDRLPGGFLHIETYLQRQPALIAELPATNG